MKKVVFCDRVTTADRTQYECQIRETEEKNASDWNTGVNQELLITCTPKDNIRSFTMSCVVYYENTDEFYLSWGNGIKNLYNTRTKDEFRVTVGYLACLEKLNIEKAKFVRWLDRFLTRVRNIKLNNSNFS